MKSKFKMPWVEKIIADHPQLEGSVLEDTLILSVHCKNWKTLPRQDGKFYPEPEETFTVQRCVRRKRKEGAAPEDQPEWRLEFEDVYDVKTTRHTSIVLQGPRDELYTYELLDGELALVWKRSEQEVFVILLNHHDSESEYLLPKVSNTYLAF